MRLNTERVALNSCLLWHITGISSTMLIIRISLAGAVVVAHRRPKLLHGEILCSLTFESPARHGDCAQLHQEKQTLRCLHDHLCNGFLTWVLLSRSRRAARAACPTAIDAVAAGARPETPTGPAAATPPAASCVGPAVAAVANR
jgi:hypothetical protein